MPAPLAKGPGAPRSSSPHTPPQRRPNHPLQTGLIIAASVLVAAGIAIYESPQVRQWVDQSRRKIAVALHSLGDEIQPRRSSESSDDFELRKRKREELVRRNRNELIRRAREEGVAVDLDELARIGREDVERAERRGRRTTSASERSFDELVGSDGMLRTDDANAHKATGTDTPTDGLRKRGAAGFAAGAAAGAAVANPFSDDNVLFDRDEEEAPSPKPFIYTEPGTRESTATLEASIPQSEASVPALVSSNSTATDADADQAAQSFYSFASSASHHFEDEAEHLSTGTLTPRSEHSAHSAHTGASVVGSHADDIALLSMQNDSDHDARSEVFSESGFTEAGFSEAGFSELGEGGAHGVLTPSSWTDVGSDDESEWGGVGGMGTVSQVQQGLGH
ncbi:hypothetical protein K458DRAFT_452002 [Lentithecium fluviatile CBS 122367]|uniref:Uncharacterized protein n=1 Tax=Lentithecium fluviatile CBS 122367 TaxID=1168545 RepID=A0A6G1J1Y0_9PLEO|nr:hypothetical protein K458DRAFT_452002 [Lentithecium fluviatile CBS 122367]